MKVEVSHASANGQSSKFLHEAGVKHATNFSSFRISRPPSATLTLQGLLTKPITGNAIEGLAFESDFRLRRVSLAIISTEVAVRCVIQRY